MNQCIAAMVSTFVFCAMICLAQSSAYSQVEKQGGGVRLLITLSTNMIDADTSFVVAAEIENTSTNVVYVAASNPRIDFYVELVNSTGKTILLTEGLSPFQTASRNFRKEIKPGTNCDFMIPITSVKNIPVGDYDIKATTKFDVGNEGFKLESNLLKVHLQ